MLKIPIICLLLFFCCFVYGKKPTPVLTITKWITDIPPPDVNDLFGRVYVVEFWAIWCDPCIRNIPHLNDLATKYKEVPIISITPSQEEKKLRQIIEKHKIKYHVAFGSDSIAAFGVRSYPTAFVFNHKGKIIWDGHPANPDFEKAIQKALIQKGKNSGY